MNLQIYKIFKSNKIVFILFVLLSKSIFSASEIPENWKDKFFEGNFQESCDLLKKKEGKILSVDDKLYFAEVLLRTGNHSAAKKILEGLKNKTKFLPEILSVAAMLDISEGKFIDAKEKIFNSFKFKKDSLRVLRAKLIYNLYIRNFKLAESIFKKIGEDFLQFSRSALYHRLGIEIFKYTKNFKGLSTIYNSRLKVLRKRAGKILLNNLKADKKLYKKKINKSFLIDSKSDHVELPFINNKKGHINTVYLTMGGKKYSVIIDTGNLTGWMIHNRDLREFAKTKTGGRIVTSIGSESGNLDGFSIYCKSIDFKGFKLKNLFGIYVPKPRSDFYDANLNPIYIKNRVTTLDFINKKIVFRTEERFENDLKLNRHEIMRIPWFGYRYPLVPVIISGINGFGIIETGADDISIRINTAKKLNLPLIPKIKYLSNGKKFKYSLCPVEIQLGKYVFVRKNAEVWPLKRFSNTFTGFTANVVLGPEAFRGKFAVSFLPKKNIIVFEYEKKKI